MKRTLMWAARAVVTVAMCLLLVVTCFPGVASATWLTACATQSDLIDDSIWLTQSSNGYCTLASTAMMLRRTSILNGIAGWENITERSIRSAAWDESAGLRWNFSYAGIHVAEVDLDYSDEDLLIELIEEHPEGVVIYNWAHAVLLTDYTDGVLYCADPAFGDRRPLSESSRGVSTDNIWQYWYVTSRVNPPTPDDGDDDDPDNPVLPDPPELTGEWVRSGSRWWYRWADGSYAQDEMLVLDGVEYLFDDAGWMVTGWWLDGDEWLYCDWSGAVAHGWRKVNGSWYWLDPDTGIMATGWIRDGDSWYYLKSSGAMATGWLLDGNTWYYLTPSGAMATGWCWVNGSWYYLKSSGAMATGWANDNGTWYYLKSSGSMATGWILDGSTWYYLTPSGAMAHDRWVGNYYLGSNGAMLTDTITPDGYRVKASGAWDGRGKVS
ncbi:MAG: hypothetical protein Q4D48_02175 [Coriobacteriales bacterium]|nr:hypothetical protein [Coriobacteriales bacterium]